jgi:hypothetical protein
MSFRDLAQMTAATVATQLGEAATYVPDDGALPFPVQVISASDREAELQPFGRGAISPQRVFKVLVSAVAAPKKGDRLRLADGRMMEVSSDPRREDNLGQMWTLPCREVP